LSYWRRAGWGDVGAVGEGQRDVGAFGGRFAIAFAGSI